ncbi:MAG: hypothetical protein H7Z39_05700 [Burkholderiaceae bacterium]|nr:hypothetical protein [Burkholderiaceae bacterium]
MTEAELIEEAIGLIDREAPALLDAEADARDQEGAYSAALEAFVLAGAAVAAAEADRAALLESAVQGAFVSALHFVGAAAAVVHATMYLRFNEEVVARLAGPLAAARAWLSDSRHQACLPILRAGQDHRIDAARLADRAALAPRGDPATVAAMAAARLQWERGRELIRAGVTMGLRFPRHPIEAEPTWPAREASERRFWARPVETQELEDAA